MVKRVDNINVRTRLQVNCELYESWSVLLVNSMRDHLSTFNLMNFVFQMYLKMPILYIDNLSNK